MKTLAPLLPITCFVVAGWLAVSGTSGWGWFLFVGLLVSGAI